MPFICHWNKFPQTPSTHLMLAWPACWSLKLNVAPEPQSLPTPRFKISLGMRISSQLSFPRIAKPKFECKLQPFLRVLYKYKVALIRLQSCKTGMRKMSMKQSLCTQLQNVSFSKSGWLNNVFPPNWAQECGQAAIIFVQITSWTFSLICFNIINSPVLQGRGKFSILPADKYAHIMWPTFSSASGCTFWLSLINILSSSYQIVMENQSLE